MVKHFFKIVVTYMIVLFGMLSSIFCFDTGVSFKNLLLFIVPATFTVGLCYLIWRK